MSMSSTYLQENNENVNMKLFLLDPLSVIIQLAILSNKPIGTKFLISNNIIYLQEPGLFQSICRKVYNSNKTDLQFMYNPIQIACLEFLSKENLKQTPRIKTLFICAQNGIKKLIETYKNCSILCLCLHYYYAIITFHIEEKYDDILFYKDSMTIFYTKELIHTLNEQWTSDKIKVILDLISFLSNDEMASNNIKTIETIIENNNKNIIEIFSKLL